MSDQSEKLTCHPLVKQIYWPIAPAADTLPDPHDNSHYHLLAPLYASPVSQFIFETIEQHREEVFEMYKAKKKSIAPTAPYCIYSDLVVEIKGGSNKQNVSMLNSKRSGKNYLLASLPPQWDNSDTHSLYHTDSIFARFGRRKAVRELVRELRQWLAKHHRADKEAGEKDPNNRHIRNRRDALLEQIFEELLQLGGSIINQLSSGWTADPACQLPIDEQCWLDPRRAETDEDFNKAFQFQDWPQQLAERFARWLNGQLGDDKLQLAEAESHYWSHELAHDLDWQRQLDASRRQQDNRLLPTARSNGTEANHAR